MFQLIKYRKKLDIYKLDEFLVNDKIWGKCMDCPTLVQIDRECVNAEGNLVELKKEMFVCEKCISNTIKNDFYNSLPYKNCPHCGVLGKPMPSNCNYLYCDDHHWRYNCLARLPGDTYGHNHHFWVGLGTSAYDFKCRVTKKSIEPTHVLKVCNCKHCCKRGGKSWYE